MKGHDFKMNVREIAKISGWRVEENGSILSGMREDADLSAELENFARLIINECCVYVDTYTNGIIPIKEYFGIGLDNE
jgi:hypothetical protein